VWQSHGVFLVFPAYTEEARIAAAVADFGGSEAVDEVPMSRLRSTQSEAGDAGEDLVSGFDPDECLGSSPRTSSWTTPAPISSTRHP